MIININKKALVIDTAKMAKDLGLVVMLINGRAVMASDLEYSKRDNIIGIKRETKKNAA